MGGTLVVGMLALIATVIALLGWRRAGALDKQVRLANEEAEAIRRHVNVSDDALKKDITELRRALYARTATGRFSAEMTVAEALELHPDAAAVMATFHLGGCSSCAISAHHVLGPAAQSYNVDLDALLTALNALLDGAPIPTKQVRGMETVAGRM